MSSNPASPTRPSPSDLQSHLYTSFLQRKTADVALRISGSWNAIYRLHRVILIQAVRRTFCAFWLSLLIPFELHRASFSHCLLRASASPHLSCTVITEIRIVSILFSMTLISRELVSKRQSCYLPALRVLCLCPSYGSGFHSVQKGISYCIPFIHERLNVITDILFTAFEYVGTKRYRAPP